MEATQTIVPEHLYPEAEAKRRMGWGRHALQEARKRGLKAMRCGKRNYYLGRDLIGFVLADSQKPEAVSAEKSKIEGRRK